MNEVAALSLSLMKAVNIDTAKQQLVPYNDVIDDCLTEGVFMRAVLKVIKGR